VKRKPDWVEQTAARLAEDSYMDGALKAPPGDGIKRITRALRRAEKRGYKKGCDKPCGNCGAGMP
jgi:hypothetical protein